MKKYFSIIFILIILGSFIYPSRASAITCYFSEWDYTDVPDAQTCANAGGSLTPIDTEPNVFTDPIGALVDRIDPLSWPVKALGRVAIVILQVASLVTYLGGVVLNYVIQYTVVNMKVNISGAGAIDLAWTTIRNVANMFFIFILLYAAIKTIIGQGDNARELIVRVVLVAILINFSLFFTKIIIDASNILAITFYDAIAPGALTSADWLNTGLSNSLMQPLKLQSLWNSANSGELTGDKLVTIGIMGTIVTLIAGFVFFAVAIMFIIRFVVLIFLLILSPLAFMGYVLPKLQSKVSDKWLDALLGQAIFAPLYFLLTWIVIVISRGLFSTSGDMASAFLGTSAGAGAAAGTAGTFQTNASSIAIFMNFMIMIVFLIASLILSKEYASRGGAGIQSATKWAMGFAGGASFGLAGRAGRYTLGAGAEAFKESKAYKRMEAASPNSTLARLGLATVDKTRKASFDARGGRVGGMLGAAGLDAGKAKEGGFEADKKGVREFLERPGTESRKARLERGRGAQNELDVNAGAKSGATPAEIAAMETALAKMSDKEVEAIASSNRKLLESQALANTLSSKQLEALNKSDKFSETEKDSLKSRRFAAINDGVAALSVPPATRTPAQAAAVAALPGATRNLSDSELEMIDASHLSNHEFVGNLRAGQIDSINKSGKFTTSQKAAVRGARQQPLLNELTAAIPSIPAIQTAARRLNPKELNALMRIPGRGGVTAALDPAVLPIYTPQILKRMAPDMDPSDITTLRTAIITGLATPPGTPAHPTVAWLTTGAGSSEFA